MSRMINRLYGRVYGWFDSKDARTASKPLPARFRNSRSQLAITNLEDRVVPAQFVVNLTTDNGVSTVGQANGTVSGNLAGDLRYCFVQAQAAAGADLITFDTSFNTGINVIALASVLPTMGVTAAAGHNVTITGPGPDKLILTRDFSKTAFNRPLQFAGNSTFVLEDMTITGFSGASTGGAIYMPGTSDTPNLTINRCNITGNVTTATGSTATIYFFGAGLFALNNSTISNNVSAGNGGALRVWTTDVTITNSTISGNVAVTGSAVAMGSTGVDLVIRNSTITGNSATSATATLGSGGSISGTGTSQTLTVTSSIIAGNSATNGKTDFSTGTSVNVTLNDSVIGLLTGIGDTTISGANNTNNVTDPRLSLLGYNGGPTATRVPLQGTNPSPAIGVGTNSPTPFVDQTGTVRAAPYDRGAIEITIDQPYAVVPERKISNPTLQNLPSFITSGTGPNPYVFEAAFYDDDGIDVDTFTGNEFVITGPNNFSVNATLSAGQTLVDGEYVTANFEFNPPGGTWEGNDSGVYVVSSILGGVEDINGADVLGGLEGAFIVAIPRPIASNYGTSGFVSSPQTAITFTVKYTDVAGGLGIEYDSLLGNNIRVVGPGFPADTFATFVSSSLGVNNDGSPLTATYSITGPDGSFDATELGNVYTLSLDPSQVANTAGTFVAAATLGSLVVSFPQTFTVDTDTDVVDAGDGLTSLREAIIAANAGPDSADTINFYLSDFAGKTNFSTAKTITLVGTLLPTIVGSVTILSQGAAVTITKPSTIAGNLLNLDRAGGTETVNLTNLRLLGTTAFLAFAALGVTDETVTLTNTTITGVTGTGTGAGISGGNPTLTLNNSIVNANSTSGAGGGISLSTAGSTLTITNTTINANTNSTSGGGVRLVGPSTITVTGSTITFNASTTTVTGLGGGFSIGVGSLMVVDNSTIDSNSSGGSGGGIAMSATGTGQGLYITNSTISRNTANSTTVTNGGGGIAFGGIAGHSSGKGFLVRNSTIAGNSAAQSGGGILFNATVSGIIDIQNTTIANNTAASNSTTLGSGGGGITVASVSATLPATVSILSTILSGNTATGAANTADDVSWVSNANLSATIDYSALADQSEFTAPPPLGTFTLGSNNLTAAESSYSNLKLTTPSGGAPFGLALNGNLSGFITKTIALGAGSTAKDKGINPTAPTIALLVDQTGNPRVFSPVSPPPGVIDIGSQERISGAPQAALGTVNGVYVTTAPNPYTFDVTYSDDVAVEYDSLVPAGTDITFTRIGGGPTINASLVTTYGTIDDAPSIKVGYSVVPPDGSWTFDDNGVYEFKVLAGAVTNTDGAPIAGATIGTLTVGIGKTIVVDTIADTIAADGKISLREAIIEANTNIPGSQDTITFDQSSIGATPTITLTSEIAIADALSINGLSPSSRTTISGGGTTRLFNINMPGIQTVNFSNLNLTGASSATRGGAILYKQDTLNFTDCDISGNTNSGNGGAIGGEAGGSNGLNLTRVTVSNNKAATGGFLDLGGGGGTVTVTDSTVSNNTATTGAGAFATPFVNLTVTNSTITGNSAAASGGAFQFVNGATVNIINSTVSGNTTSGTTAGAAFNFASTATYLAHLNIRNSTITLNSNTTTGVSASGGIHWANTNANSTITLNSTIIAGNLIASASTTSSPDIRFSAAKNVAGENNLLGVGDPSETNGTFTGVNYGTANGKASPLLAKLLPLASNGGLTQTHAILPGTPGSDKGSNIIEPMLTKDQRGGVFNRTENGITDIGAFERIPGIPVALPDSFAPVVSPVGDYTFSVSYANEVNLDLTTFGALLGNDVLVTGPNSYSQPGIISGSPVPTPDDKFVVVTYTIPAPSGGWVGIGAEVYTVTAQGGTVKSTNNQAIATAVLGTIRVDLPTTFVVTTELDVVSSTDGLVSLREAVTGSNANTAFADLITFSSLFDMPQTIKLDTALGIIDVVTIQGPTVMGSKLTITKNPTAPAMRIFDTSVGAPSAAIVFNDLTISGGSVTGDGGGINIGDEAVTLNRVIVENNTASTDGGGIEITTAAGTLTINSSIIRNNKALAGEGGGIEIVTTSVVIIDKSTISGNSASAEGGGIYFLSGVNLTMTNSTVSGNTASGTLGGGGVYFDGAIGSLAIINSTISGNTSTAGPGGGIVFRTITGAATTIDNTTITGNSAPTGGGIAFTAGTPTTTLTNVIVSGNTAATGPDISSVAGTLNASYSAIGSSSGFTLATSTKNLAYGVNLMLGGLADNGGPTFTHLPSLDGPLVNRGTNAVGGSKDQRDFARPVGLTDIGSVEAGTPPKPYGILDTAETPVDGAMATAITVTFYDGVTGILGTSLTQGNELVVTGPDGTTYPVNYVSGAADGPSVPGVVFSMPAPGGTWGAGDGGEYTISLVAGGISSQGPPTETSNAGVLGTFVADFVTTYTVITTNDDGIGSLRRALYHSNLTASDDTITFGGATFTDGAADLIAPLSELTVSDSVVIDGNQTKSLLSLSGSGARRIFAINDGVAGTAITVTIQDMSLINGSAAGAGGAVLIQDETVTFNRVNFTGNRASTSGAAINLTLPTNITLTVTDSSFTGNTAATQGGAINIPNPGSGTATLLVSGSSFTSNTAGTDGGALNLGSTTLPFTVLVENSLFASNVTGNNDTTGDGSAIYFRGTVGAGGFVIRNSTITGNSAGSSSKNTSSVGAALSFPLIEGNIFIQNSTIARNTATSTSPDAFDGGGGIAISDRSATVFGVLNLESSVVAYNVSANGHPDISSQSNVNYSFSAIGTDSFNDGTAASNLAFGIDLKLGVLADYTGASRTHMVLAGSPLLEAGTATTTPGYPDLTTDQRGSGFLRTVGLTDIGAFERQATDGPGAALGSFNNVFVNDMTTNPYKFTVTYVGNTAINPSSIGDNLEVIVSSIDGSLTQNATFLQLDPGADPLVRTATYQILPFGTNGIWDGGDNSDYAVNFVDGSVTAASGPVRGGTVGSFTVFLTPFVVVNTNDAGPGSLRQAILSANSNADASTILFSSLFDTPQTILLTSGELSISAPLVLDGKGALLTTIDANDNGRHFNLTAAPAGAAIEINNLTLTNGSMSGTGDAASIFIADEALTLRNMRITNNTAGGQGGAIFTDLATSLTIINSTLSGNVSLTTSFGGGAMYLTGGTGSTGLNIQNSTLSGNSAAGTNGGGAIYMWTTAFPVTISNSTFSNNTSAASGGAIRVNGTHPITISNSTIVNNSAGTTGGGLSTTTGVVVLDSTVIAGNTATTATTHDLNVASNLTANFSAWSVAPVSSVAGNVGNILNTPVNLGLGTLADNGGPHLTVAINPAGLLHNAGRNTLVLPTDQRGFTRDVGQTDIGAVEVQPSVLNFTINGGAGQRSRITTITVNFDIAVTPALFAGVGAIQLIKSETGSGTIIQTGATGANGLISVAQGTATSLVLTFSNADLADVGAVEYGSLADGRYRLSLPGTANAFISNPAVPAQQIRRIFGDINGDGTVDGPNDFALFGAVFGTSVLPGNPFDFNQDLTIDGTTDFAAFGNRFGNTV